VNRNRLLTSTVAAMATLGVCLIPSQAAQASTPTCLGRKATIVGTPGNDKIIGTSGRDVIVGRGGDDLILGLGGNDVICGNGGHDVINAMGGTGSAQPIDGGGSADLCVFPHQDSSSVHSCEGQSRPDPLDSDPPDTGAQIGNVGQAQTVATSGACSAAHGKTTVSFKFKVSALKDTAADILFEPTIFTYDSSAGTWGKTFLDVKTFTLPAYNGKYNKFTVSQTIKNSEIPTSNGVYYLGYYIQWYDGSSSDSSIDGNLWTFVKNYPQKLRGSTQNVGLCLPRLG
jgi:hypothetical protein